MELPNSIATQIIVIVRVLAAIGDVKLRPAAKTVIEPSVNFIGSKV